MLRQLLSLLPALLRFVAVMGAVLLGKYRERERQTAVVIKKVKEAKDVRSKVGAISDPVDQLRSRWQRR